jgi:hypothetical protein
LIDRLQRARGGDGDAERLRLRKIGLDETAHGGLGRLAPALVAADPVGDDGDDVVARPGGDVVLIVLPGSALGGEAEPDLQRPAVAAHGRKLAR